MGYIYFNNNPLSLKTGDCVVRALSKLFNQSWDETYTGLCLNGIAMGQMPSTNSVHQEYMRQRGYEMHTLSSICPDCITVKEFSERFPNGKYLLATGDHVVALIDGNYYDAFDSGQELVAYFFTQSKKRKEN